MSQEPSFHLNFGYMVMTIDVVSLIVLLPPFYSSSLGDPLEAAKYNGC